MGLTEYKKKRDFAVTAEPAGGKPLPKAVKGASRFVIQKHDATRLHYDFRLEMDGVLKSWAVPEGICRGRKAKSISRWKSRIIRSSTRPSKACIPKGQYGGGTVMVWDRGNVLRLRRRSAEVAARRKTASRLARRKGEGRMGVDPHADAGRASRSGCS